MFKAAIALVRINSTAEALPFYRDKLGFTLISTYQPDPNRLDPAYHVAARDSALLHISSFPGDGVVGGVVTITVDNIVALHGELVGKGVDVGDGILDQSWGNREVYVRDPDGNSVRFQSKG